MALMLPPALAAAPPVLRPADLTAVEVVLGAGETLPVAGVAAVVGVEAVHDTRLGRIAPFLIRGTKTVDRKDLHLEVLEDAPRVAVVVDLVAVPP